MFGIGLPEMLLILAIALIVVGPDKLPDLARSIAKGAMELKKTAEGLKESMEKESNPLAETQKDLEAAAKNFQANLLGTPDSTSGNDTGGISPQQSPKESAQNAYQELMKNKVDTSNFIEIEPDDEPLPPTGDKQNGQENLASAKEQEKDGKL